MKQGSETQRYSHKEEIANSITHGIGILFGIGGLGILVIFSRLHGTAWHIVSCTVFSITLILLYTTSTLYHSIQLPRMKTILRRLDHSAIFLLIAGTYTPFTLVNLRGPWGWSLFGIVWGLAVLGIIFELFLLGKWPILSVSLYIAMGWVVVIAIKPLIQVLAPGGLILMFSGGVAYTAGTGFYLWRSLPYHHAVWHLFVLTGSMLHFFAVLFYVIP
jgi:hemolysin III